VDSGDFALLGDSKLYDRWRNRRISSLPTFRNPPASRLARRWNWKELALVFPTVRGLRESRPLAQLTDYFARKRKFPSPSRPLASPTALGHAIGGTRAVSSPLQLSH